jgi:DUF1365 family protein
MPASCAYEGWIRHRRFEPVAHELRVRLFMLYLDLAELPELFDGYRIASARGRAPAELRRTDFFGDPRRPLADEIRALVAARTGAGPRGPIRLLANLRYLGHCFNPVSFYYCFGPNAERVETVVAEVTNTPWSERHAYVLLPDAARPPGALMRGRFVKEFHVSPFMGMDHVYAWRMTEPGAHLIVHIESEREQRLAFDATLSLERRSLTPASLRRLLVSHPLLTLRILALIYAHGLRLWAKGATYFPHPSGTPAFRVARGHVPAWHGALRRGLPASARPARLIARRTGGTKPGM